MMSPKGSKAALYVRVSLAEQAQHGFSIDGQIEALRRYCKLNHLEIYDIYVDAGASGRSTKGRPQLARMLADGAQRRYQIALIWRISRLSRHFSDLLAIVDSFKQNGIVLRSLTEQFDSETPLGGFVLQMMGAAAELERVNIGENVRITALERGRQGKWNGGNNVLGYRWLSSLSEGEGCVEIVPHEAAIVRRIFEMYATGKFGLKAITNRLNHDGLRTKKGNLVSILAVRGILQNRNYIGHIRYNGTENRRTRGAVAVEWSVGEHPPIISESLWESVHAIYTKRSKPVKRKIDRPFPLAGLLRCPQCDSGMIPGRTQRQRKDRTYRTNYYYGCGSYNAKGATACKANHVRADDVERTFYHQLQRFLGTPEMIDGIAKAAAAKRDVARTPILERIRHIDEELAQLATRHKQIFHDFENGKLDKERLVDELDSLKQCRQELQLARENAERELTSCPVPAFSAQAIQAALKKLRVVLESEPTDKQKHLLRKLVNKITLPPDRDLSRLTIHGSDALLNLKITNQMEEFK